MSPQLSWLFSLATKVWLVCKRMLGDNGGGVSLPTPQPFEAGLPMGHFKFRSEFELDYDSYHEDYYDRVYDYQRVPASLSPLPLGPSLAKRSRSSSHSSGHRRSRDRTHSKSSRTHSTNSATAKLGMEELQVIKKELTLIKTQIDGLLDSLDRMDTQRNDHKGSPLTEDSPAGSPYALSTSSPEHSLSPPSFRHKIHRESHDLREPDDDHHTYPVSLSVCHR
ncbi:heterogeneous nuclear ribonucleoproteins C1/C2-like isoform X2 [Mastacembelus armatus]|uniref:heterogeneous nuclear ribonucleoproteins C1/C2-like isoform X2 n=1 Tax=Mastacembelus armatus TaxID=205130 RepID=UPI000E454D20|nr:heterogeneous nuclear ribonucleoproteins C1/C2-like isoform X2 [Mastacembelus armatus]